MKVEELIKEFLTEYSQPCTDIESKEYLQGRLEELDDLTKRLQDDYAGEKDFEQEEQDRLCTCDLCEFIEFLLEKIGDNK